MCPVLQLHTQEVIPCIGNWLRCFGRSASLSRELDLSWRKRASEARAEAAQSREKALTVRKLVLHPVLFLSHEQASLLWGSAAQAWESAAAAREAEAEAFEKAATAQEAAEAAHKAYLAVTKKDRSKLPRERKRLRRHGRGLGLTPCWDSYSGLPDQAIPISRIGVERITQHKPLKDAAEGLAHTSALQCWRANIKALCT